MADGPFTPTTPGGIKIAGLRDLFTWAGFTRPQPPVEDVKPRVDAEPIGASGRAHFNGFIQFDEYLTRLVGIEGLRIFDMMYRSDPHVRRNVLAVWSPIQSATWEVVPHGEDDATDADIFAAELCEWALWAYMKPNLVEHLATVGPILLRSGFCPFEQVWKTADFRGKKVIVPRKLDLRLPRTIWKWYQDEYGELSAVEQLLPNAASVLIPASELVYYRLQSEGDNWTGTSLLRQAYKPWFYKEHFEKIDAIGQERKAVGVPIVYPPQGVDPVTREEVETVLANLHVNQAGYLLMPGPKASTSGDPNIGWEVEIVTFDSSSGSTVKDSIEYQVRAIAAAFLADFLELGHHQVGARATAEVQDDPFLTAVNALGDVVAIPLNELIARIATLNVPGITGPPKLKMAMHDDASLSELATYAKELVTAGIMVADPELEDYLRERADFPPANPEIRKQHEQAQQAAREAAANGEQAEGAQGKPEPRNDGGKGDPDAQGGHSGADANESKNGPQKPVKQLDAPSPPPNLRESSSVRDSTGIEHECGTCRMWYQGRCWGYGNLPTNPEWVCDSWTRSSAPHDQDPDDSGQRSLEDAGSAHTPAITGAWYERLLSQGKLKEALDGARDEMQRAATTAAYNDAQTIVAHALMGGQPSREPSEQLVSAIQSELERLYRVGYETVQHELAKQHAILGTTPLRQLADEPPAGGGAGRRLARARDRAKLAAQNVVGEIYSRVQRAAISAIKGAGALEQTAREAADGALRVEALANASAAINEGRADAAAANQPDVVGGIYTSVLDGNTCDVCASTDTGDIQQPDELELLGPPNPNCAGGDRCRCMIVWVLTEDPRALAAGLGELIEG